ncbi:MAG: alpha/beta hydrolase [Candidatus Eremiobacteraeota bacterium]|nr:alpha/beta hydrolase [Candidatus Eremiobacteraeota bacterium]
MIETLWVRCTDGVMSGARCNVSVPQDRGDDLPVIFVHGVGSTAAIWDYQLNELTDYRCYAIELRGNGAHSPPPDPAVITREGFASDVLAIADAVRAERFHFVGCSLGGVVGFELWKRAPERIASYTIVGSFAKYPNSQAYVAGIESAVRAAGSMDAFAQQRAAKLGLPPQRLTETLEQMGCKPVPSYLASTHATWTGDYRVVLSTITAPTLVICGEHDTIAPLPLSQEIAGAIPAARLEILSNAGHVANADNPAAFNRLLLAFLGRP